MNISLSFVEYDAVNSLRDLSPTAFTLLSTARLGLNGHKRMWVVTGTADAFALLRGDLTSAKKRFLRTSISAAVATVVQYIDEAGAIMSPKAAEPTETMASLLATPVAPAAC